MLTSVVLIAVVLLPQQAQDTPGARHVAGTVIDAKGAPIEGTNVWLSGIAWFGEKTPVLARTTTASQGRFQVTIPPVRDDGKTLEALAIWAHRTGSAVGALAFDRSKPPQPETTKLALGAPCETRFQVIGPDGQPLDNAKVTPFMFRARGDALVRALFLPDVLADRLAIRAGADGKGTFRELPPEEIHLVRVASERYGIQRVEFKLGEGGIATITLAPVGRVSGRVVADSSEQVRDLAIVVMTFPNGRSVPKLGEVQVVTGTDGRFEVPALAVGGLRLFLRTNDEGSKVLTLCPTDLIVEAGKLTEVEVPLDGSMRKRTVEGVVLDRKGQPVAGALVLQSGDGPKRTRATTDELGRFRLPGVNEGKAFVFVAKEGFHFEGGLIDQPAGAVEVVLARSDEPRSLSLKTLPPLLPHEEELKLARRLIDPYLEKVLKDGDEAAKVKTLAALAAIPGLRFFP